MRYVLLILIVMVGIASCKKTNSYNTRILFYNASWSVPAVSAAWNETGIVSTALAQGQASGTAAAPYLEVAAGTNLITIKAGSTELLDKNIYAAAAASSSFIVFDTGTAAGAPRILQLTDDLTLPDTGRFKFRLLKLSPDPTVKLDTWLVSGTLDSLKLDSAGIFAGALAEASALQAFTPLIAPAGSYSIKVKKTATNEVVAAVANYPFSNQGIYSFILSGLPSGTGAAGYKLSVLRHPTQ
jgi:Domain of unknown function (DUF4397)